MGDFNAMLQSEGSDLYSPNKSENRNSRLLLDFIECKNLVQLRHYLEKSLVSFYGPNN